MKTFFFLLSSFSNIAAMQIPDAALPAVPHNTPATSPRHNSQHVDIHIVAPSIVVTIVQQHIEAAAAAPSEPQAPKHTDNKFELPDNR